MHSIAVDASSGTIGVTLAGTMSTAKVDEYMTELTRVMVDRRLTSDYGIVIDVTGCTVETQDMTRAMSARMAAMPRARAIAVVATSQLARLQIRRLFVQDYARIVSTPEEGRAWVIDRVEPGAERSTGGAAVAVA